MGVMGQYVEKTNPEPPKRSYTPEDVTRALVTLAVTGSPRQTSERLEIPESTLRRWRDNVHADQYRQLQRDHAAKLEQVIVEQVREAALVSGAIEREALDRLAQNLHKLEPRDLANTIKNLKLTQGISIDKMLALTGRPTVITEHRNADELVAKLTAAGVIEGTAQEITSADR